MNHLLRVYHNLPSPVRSVAATFRGFYLRSSRYGAETEKMMLNALERENWSVETWEEFQQKQLSSMLFHAVRTVPYYKEQWGARHRNGDHASWEKLENWPILEKDTVRNNPKAFLSDHAHARNLYRLNTSGTTGKQITLWRDKAATQAWYALTEARSRQWYGVSRNDRWAILGGQLVTPVWQRHPPFWVWNSALNQLYMSSYHLRQDMLYYYLDALKKYRIQYLYGYTSSLYELARVVIQSERDDLKMTVAISNAEPVFDYQRAAIEEAFQCSLRETYGMAEMAVAASECQEGRLHLWPEVARIELFDNGYISNDHSSGEVISTSLLNTAMPLIRYRVGDRVVISGSDDGCACGRRLPLLKSVEGRADDVLYTCDGRRIGRLDPVFKSSLPISEAQIVQETLCQVKVRYIAVKDLNAAEIKLIVEELQARMGAIEVGFERVPEIPRTTNGKFRSVICNLPPEQKQRLAQA